VTVSSVPAILEPGQGQRIQSILKFPYLCLHWKMAFGLIAISDRLKNQNSIFASNEAS